jgi:hypothetical protein
VLISHRRQFIYLKTYKTGGTSVEILFQSECLPADWSEEPQHSTEQMVTDAGIVGARKPDTTGAAWFNHMPAAALREKIGPEIWDSYLKFCVVRNPYDRVVSWWWHRMDDTYRRVMADADLPRLRAEFSSWVLRTTDMGMDRDKYLINGKVCVDRFIRYERLWDDVLALCCELGIERKRSDLGAYKSGVRANALDFPDYYEPAAAAKVATWFQWELDNFGYGLS